MTDRDVVVTNFELATGYGPGADLCAEGLYGGFDAFAPVTRFAAPGGERPLAAEIKSFPKTVTAGKSILDPMLEFLEDAAKTLPDSAILYLATTVGEIDLLEKAESDTAESLLKKALLRFGKNRGCVISGACASSNLAAARAFREIRSGKTECAVVLGIDAVTEFVWSGFSALGAVSPGSARPYDRDRDGLIPGDAAGVLCLASREFARARGLRVRAVLEDAAGSCDAAHITAPSPDGSGLALALRKLDWRKTGAVIGHGTGTVYNDAMELAAFRSVFGAESARALPLASTKGGCGHTLGASGLVQAVMAVFALERGELFPQTNLRNADPLAEGMVSTLPRKFDSPHVLSVNAGFGGVNSVLMFGRDGTAGSPDKLFPMDRKKDVPGCFACGNHRREDRNGLLRDAERQGSMKKKILGAAYVPGSGSGRSFRKKYYFPDADAIPSAKDVPPADWTDFKRGSVRTKNALLAAALAFADSGRTPAPECSVTGSGANGCFEDNRTYFADYLAAGRLSARGRLFVSTLPTTPLCECAIAFGLHGETVWFAPEKPLPPEFEGPGMILHLRFRGNGATAFLLEGAEEDTP